MTTVALDIPCLIDREEIMQKLHVKPGSRFEKKADEIIAQAQAVARPKIAYKLAAVEEKGEDFVVIEGTKFTSRILRVNLEETSQVVLFVITCGTELKKWAESFQEMFDMFCADAVMEWVLLAARDTAFIKLDEEFAFGHTANMNPGSLPDWPLEEQKPLFQLLGDVRGLIGVELNDHFLMEPLKTISGIHFFMEGSYKNCLLCSRKNCPGRKAPYDKDLYAEKYQSQ